MRPEVWLGIVLLAVGVSTLLIWVSMGGSQFEWDSSTSITLAVTAGVDRTAAGELEHRGLEISRLLHPVVGVERDGQGGWHGTVAVAEHLGSDTFLYVDAGPQGMLTARYIGELDLHPGDKVSLIPDPARIHRFDDSGKSIHA